MNYINQHEFFLETNGKIIDVDGAYGGQCWDLFSYYCQKYINKTFSCLWSGYVKDLWYHFGELGLGEYFEQITDRHALQDGDWLIWDKEASEYCWISNYSHIAMFREYNPSNGEQNIILTQNPNGNPNYTHQMVCDFHGFIGALRPKIYIPKKMPLPVERDINVDQIKVNCNDTMRVRTGYALDSEVIGLAAEGYYNILKTYIDENYTWFEVENEIWIAGVEGYVSYISKEEPKIIVETPQIPTIGENNTNSQEDTQTPEIELKQEEIEHTKDDGKIKIGDSTLKIIIQILYRLFKKLFKLN